MRAALVGIGRLENRYAREWVEHHLSVGFDTIIIADNNRVNEERFDAVLGDYIKKGAVIVEDYRDKVAVQLSAYNSIYAKYKNDFDWFAFFDFDEFLSLNDGSVADLLECKTADVVMVNWQCYGDNGLVRDDGRGVMERFTEPLPAELCVQYGRPENDHIKSIVRGGLAKMEFAHNPHVPDVGNAERYVTAAGAPCKPNALQTYDGSVAVLKHYITKTAEEWGRKMQKGSGARSLAMWQQAYKGRFYQYNERTQEKENIMKKEKAVAIVHYNTPELTEATILSLRKHGGENYKVYIFDNSDERPWKKRMKGVKKFDNTKGKIVDFDKELAKYPRKCDQIGVFGKNVYGSAKHMMSVQALFDLLPDGFLLMDSDILLKENVDFMFQENQCVVGHIQSWQKSSNPYKIDRLVPMLCYINVPMCKSCGINYFDGNRCWGLHGKSKQSWYDTGASFLEDVRSHRNGARGRRIDIRLLMEHLKSGSWRGEGKAEAWLKNHEDLWK